MDNYNYDEIAKSSGDLIDNKRKGYNNAINKFIKNIEGVLKNAIHKLGYNQNIITNLLVILETETREKINYLHSLNEITDALNDIKRNKTTEAINIAKKKIESLINSTEIILNQLSKDLESIIKKYLNLNQNFSDERFFQMVIYPEYDKSCKDLISDFERLNSEFINIFENNINKNNGFTSNLYGIQDNNTNMNKQETIIFDKNKETDNCINLLNSGKSAEDIITFLDTFKEQDALDIINRLVPAIQFEFNPDKAELINSKLRLKREELKAILQEQEKKSSGYANDFM